MSFPTFQNQQYLSLETFRKNGQGVKTPVWFAQDGEVLYIWTQTDSAHIPHPMGRENSNFGQVSQRGARSACGLGAG
jgi:hypothetical protein